jgi:hypothetical protein
VGLLQRGILAEWKLEVRLAVSAAVKDAGNKDCLSGYAEGDGHPAAKTSGAEAGKQIVAASPLVRSSRETLAFRHDCFHLRDCVGW